MFSYIVITIGGIIMKCNTRKSVSVGRRTVDCCSPCCPPRCTPQRGELVKNGGFEVGVCGALWDCSGNVKPQDQIPNTGHNAHQGTGAVALGLNAANQGGNGSISQLIKGICPGLVYQFSFFMSPHSYAENIDLPVQGSFSGQYGNGEVRATLTFLDRNLNVIDSEREILIPRDTLALANVWTYYKTVTISPYNARYAFIKIAITDPYWNWQEHVHIDDVSLVTL